MSGYFEIIDSADGGFRATLRGPSGELLAVSEAFPTKRQAAAGISLIREVAGTGLIRDMSSGHRGEPFRRRLRTLRALSAHESLRRKRLHAELAVKDRIALAAHTHRTASRR
jgi:uncharacterized protein YegP (UPF0339 family)